MKTSTYSVLNILETRTGKPVALLLFPDGASCRAYTAAGRYLASEAHGGTISAYGQERASDDFSALATGLARTSGHKIRTETRKVPKDITGWAHSGLNIAPATMDRAGFDSWVACQAAPAASGTADQATPAPEAAPEVLTALPATGAALAKMERAKRAARKASAKTAAEGEPTHND